MGKVNDRRIEIEPGSKLSTCRTVRDEQLCQKNACGRKKQWKQHWRAETSQTGRRNEFETTKSVRTGASQARRFAAVVPFGEMVWEKSQLSGRRWSNAVVRAR
jgi:hypothetical protein